MNDRPQLEGSKGTIPDSDVMKDLSLSLSLTLSLSHSLSLPHIPTYIP